MRSRCASAREARTQDVEWVFDHAVSRGPSCRSPDGRTEPDRPTRDGRCHDLYVKLIHVTQRLAYAMWAASNGTWPRQENLPRRPRLIQREDEDVLERLDLETTPVPWFARTYEAARGTPALPSGHSSAAPARPENCAAQANMPRARPHPTDGEEAPGGRKIASPPNRSCPRRNARGCTKSLKARSTCKRILQKRRAYSGS